MWQLRDGTSPLDHRDKSLELCHIAPNPDIHTFPIWVSFPSLETYLLPSNFLGVR